MCDKAHKFQINFIFSTTVFLNLRRSFLKMKRKDFNIAIVTPVCFT